MSTIEYFYAVQDAENLVRDLTVVDAFAVSSNTLRGVTDRGIYVDMVYQELGGSTIEATKISMYTPVGGKIAEIRDIQVPITQNQDVTNLNFNEINILGSPGDDIFDARDNGDPDIEINVFGNGLLDARGGYDVLIFSGTLGEVDPNQLSRDGGDLVYTDETGATGRIRNVEAFEFSDTGRLSPDAFYNAVHAAPSQPNPNETIALDGRSGWVDGGEGLDTGTLVSPISSYSVWTYNGTINVQGNGTSVQLQNIERLSFSDGNLGFDETAERAYRLYEAAFNRQPDAEGLGYWIDQLDQGAEFNQVSGSFIDSQEFGSLYGTNPRDDAFVDLIYQNVLDRQPDAGGESYWTGELAQGMPRAEMLARFSDSEENRANVESQVDDGVFYL